MTALRAALVNSITLLKLPTVLMSAILCCFPREKPKTWVKRGNSILANAFEALIGAVDLDTDTNKLAIF